MGWAERMYHKVKWAIATTRLWWPPRIAQPVRWLVATASEEIQKLLLTFRVHQQQPLSTLPSVRHVFLPMHFPAFISVFLSIASPPENLKWYNSEENTLHHGPGRGYNPRGQQLSRMLEIGHTGHKYLRFLESHSTIHIIWPWTNATAKLGHFHVKAKWSTVLRALSGNVKVKSSPIKAYSHNELRPQDIILEMPIPFLFPWA